MDSFEHTAEPHDMNIGTFLSNLREEQGIDLRSISQKTRISLTLLKALEESSVEKLPDLTYVKGFVKSYAKEVGANEDHCLDLLRRTYEKNNYSVKALQGLKADSLIEENKIDISRSNSKKINTQISIKHVSIVLSGLTIGVCFFLLMRNGSPPEIKETKRSQSIVPSVNDVVIDTSPSQKSEEAIASAGPIEDGKKTTESKNEVIDKKISNALVEKKDKAETEKELAKKDEILVEKPLVKPLPKDAVVDFTIRDFTLPLYEVVPNSSEANDENFLPSRIKTSFVPNFQNVFINSIYDDSWITYKSEDRKIKSFVLKKGRTILIRGKEVRLFMGNIKAIKIFLNNQLLKVTSPTGVKSLVFPHSAHSKYKLPLFVFDKNTGFTYTTEEYLSGIGKTHLLQSAQSN
jgi:cytoskeleton protein RodZ